MVSVLRRLCVVAAAALLCAACGVPSEQSAQRVPAGQVPFQLADTTAPGTTEGVGRPDELPLYLVRDDRLVAVSRVVVPADAETALAQLAQGPTPNEVDLGMRTALVPDLATTVEDEEGLLVVDLDEEFTSLAPIEQRLALAQITLTVTQFGRDAVRFLVAGQPASVPRGDGTAIDRPVTRDDYAELIASP